jgi:hypothetical protein
MAPLAEALPEKNIRDTYDFPEESALVRVGDKAL